MDYMSPYQPPKPKRSVKTADRIVGLFVVLQEREYASVSKLADELNLAKSTTYHYLATLQNEGYVVKKNGEYRLGLRFLEHATAVNRLLGIIPIATPVMKDIADRTGEVVWLLFEEHSHPIYLSKVVGQRGVVSHRMVGDCSPSAAGGKAVLSQHPDEEVSSIIEYLKMKHPDYEIPDTETYVSQIQEVREQGYATTVEEIETGVSSVAAPILHEGDVVGAISVAGPAIRLKEELWDDLPGIVRGATNDIELRLDNHSWQPHEHQ